MTCPFCGDTSSKVVDKRDNNETGVTRRRRECSECGKRFTTYERVEAINLYVVKRSGKIEEFDREKMKYGIGRAIRKRGISDTDLEDMILAIEQQLLNHESTEIESEQIGELIMNYLKNIDQLSYLRFASVYKDFQSVEDFKAAIEGLQE